MLTLEEIQRRAMIHALRRTGGNRTKAAAALGISVRTIYRYIKIGEVTFIARDKKATLKMAAEVADNPVP